MLDPFRREIGLELLVAAFARLHELAIRLHERQFLLFAASMASSAASAMLSRSSSRPATSPIQDRLVRFRRVESTSPRPPAASRVPEFPASPRRSSERARSLDVPEHVARVVDPRHHEGVDAHHGRDGGRGRRWSADLRSCRLFFRAGGACGQQQDTRAEEHMWVICSDGNRSRSHHVLCSSMHVNWRRSLPASLAAFSRVPTVPLRPTAVRNYSPARVRRRQCRVPLPAQLSRQHRQPRRLRSARDVVVCNEIRTTIGILAKHNPDQALAPARHDLFYSFSDQYPSSAVPTSRQVSNRTARAQPLRRRLHVSPLERDAACRG